MVSALRLSHRDVEELLAGRGIEVDCVTPYRWIQHFALLAVEAAGPCPHPAGRTSSSPGRQDCQRTHLVSAPASRPFQEWVAFPANHRYSWTEALSDAYQQAIRRQT
jgi:hypothetical protein